MDEEAPEKSSCQTIPLMSTMRSSLFRQALIVKQCAESLFTLFFTSLLDFFTCYPFAQHGRRSRIHAASPREARAAVLAGEVPVGAVLVRDAKIIARSGNRTIRDTDPTAHAEMVVLREAANALGNYRLAATTLYVTIEPCSMCAGAMIQARIPRLVYGCDDPKGGAVRSCFEILSHPRLNHQVEITPGVLAADCAALIQSFFAERR